MVNHTLNLSFHQSAFYPVPEVDSALLLVELYDQPVIPV